MQFYINQIKNILNRVQGKLVGCDGFRWIEKEAEIAKCEQFGAEHHVLFCNPLAKM